VGILITKFVCENPTADNIKFSISRTVWTNALVDRGGFPFLAAILRSGSSLGTTVVCSIISWRPCTSIWAHIHPIAGCSSFLLRPVLWTIFDCPSWVISSVAAFAASRWLKWCLHCSWVSAGGVLDKMAIGLLYSVPLSPCAGACGAMICCCGSEDMMMMKQSGKFWGRRSRKEVGSPEENIGSFMSKWHQ